MTIGITYSKLRKKYLKIIKAYGQKKNERDE